MAAGGVAWLQGQRASRGVQGDGWGTLRCATAPTTFAPFAPLLRHCQVLHTYGDLSDAQLLQTYGFIDMGAAATAATPVTGGAKGMQAAKAGGGSTPSGQAAAKEAAKRKADGMPDWSNPHNYALVPLSDVRECARVSLVDQGGEDEEEGGEGEVSAR